MTTRKLAAHVFDALKGKHALGASEHVQRYFLVCMECRRIVPMWTLVGDAKAMKRAGCKCGRGDVRPYPIGELRAAWWLLVRGLLIRKLLLRKASWEPRIPFRGIKVA